MNVLKANCPSCAAPIKFKAGSTIVLVCPFCRSAVARTDRGLNDLGKVAEIVQSSSPLKLGLSGEYLGHRFELTGRAQLRHELGGFWDEWYATFSNGWVGWLAEAQGKFYITFFKPVNQVLPSFENLQLGQTVAEIENETPLMVVEKGTATSVAADGEIPYKLVPKEQNNYADLSGAGNAFGTIDYGENPPRVFVGTQVTLEEIGLGDAESVEREAQVVPAAAMGCPNCGGSLELKLPDKSERITCPFCNSLLDVNQGNLSFLKSLKTDTQFTFALPIGAKGAFANLANAAEFEIVGAIARSVTYEGTKYFWQEYLLYNPHVGFRWLVDSEQHWNFVEPVNVADVQGFQAGGTFPTSVEFNGKTFEYYQGAAATVEYVQGEFYWRVEQGETVQTADYIAPPQMLSVEATANEINWSLGTYLKKDEIERTFGVSDISAAYTVAPNQPYERNGLIRAGFIVLGIFTLAWLITQPFQSTEGKRGGTSLSYILSSLPTADSNVDFYTEPFFLEQDISATVSISSELDYERWSEFDTELLPKDDSLPITNSSVANSSTEVFGTSSSSKSITVQGDGEYQLHFKGKWEDWQKPLKVRIIVGQYKSRDSSGGCFLFILFALLPIILLISKYSFEVKRWSNSDRPYAGQIGDTFSGLFSDK